MDRLITSEPSNVVIIRVEPGQKCSGELTLRNVMYTMPVAFRLQPMNKMRYNIIPQSGIILPLAKLTLEISYQLPQTSTLPHEFPHCDDSFMLQSVVAPGAAIKNPSDNPVPSEWFTNKKKQVYSDSGIKVMFIGSTILTHLVVKGYMDEIRDVLEKSDPSWKLVDSVDSEGQTLLHLAISQGRADLVQLLLEFEPNVESTSRSGMSPLELAAVSGEALIVELLLAHKASPERSESSTWGPIHLAAANGHVEVLRHLLLKGANVNSLTKDGNTALHLAVEERRRDCVRLLLANGARADIRNASYGNTPLHIASSLGDEQIVKVLLHKGIFKDVRNKVGKTAYDLAAENGHTKLFDALRLGDNLCTAVRKGELRMVLRLLENGASINGRDQNGWTAIHRAAFKGRVDILKAMIEKGIDINAKDHDGYSALHCAAESGQVDAVELLVKRGVDLEARTNKGVTPLEIAESLQYSGIIRIILHGGNKDGGSQVGSKQKLDLFVGGEMDVGVVKKKGSRSRGVRRSGFDRSAALAVV